MAGDIRKAYKIFVGNPKLKRLLGKCDDNLKLDKVKGVPVLN